VLYKYADATAASAQVTCQVSYTYEPSTFRLSSLVTTRIADNLALQDLRFTYDAVGNIVEVEDLASTTPSIFTTTPVSGDGLYRYDPLYRLIEAQGREHPGQTGTSTQPSDVDLPFAALPHPNDLQALVRYFEKYTYDPVGNILSMAHTTTAANGGPGPSQTHWTRRYNYATDSNRLLGASVPGDPDGSFGESFNPDPHGSMRQMLHLQEIDWDYADRMQHANKGGGGDVFFTYDGSGLRVRKVWEHSGLVEQRIYVGGWETFRRQRAGALELERQTLHVHDGERRVAMVETKTVDTVDGGTGISRWRFQLDNHLGSAILELSEAAAIISYEEYHPFGSTSFHSPDNTGELSAKRYRYTGKERDDETGLYYHGARYYAAWLGRWTAADPSGLVDGPNLFSYARNQPVTLVDPNGRQSAGAFGVNPEIIKRGNYSGSETQAQIRSQYAKLHIYYRGDAVWHEEMKSWFVDRSQLTKAPKPSVHHHGAGGSGATGPGAGPDQPKAPAAPAPGTPGPDPGPSPESKAPPSTPSGPSTDPNRPASTGEAAKAFATGFVEGAAIGGALIALGPVGAVIGFGLLAYGAYKFLSGGYKEVGATIGRLATGEGTAADYQALGGVVGGIAAGGVAGAARGTAAGAEGGAAGVEGGAAGAEGGAASAGGASAGAEGTSAAAAGGAGAGSGGVQPIAVGLSRSATHSPGLVGRFAAKVGATTYWDQYPGPLPSNAEIVARMAAQFKLRPSVVNLSGLEQVQRLGVEGGLKAILREPGKTVTEAEISHILANPEFFARATFFLNGVKQTVNRAAIVGP
jgi:RHS repeat-associated protein